MMYEQEQQSDDKLASLLQEFGDIVSQKSRLTGLERGCLIDTILETIEKQPKVRPSSRSVKTPGKIHQGLALLASGIIAVVAMLFFLLTPPPMTIVRESVIGNIRTPQNSTTEEYRVSLLVLRRLSGSDSAVEFLEDAILVAEDQKLYEIPLDGHRFFLWVYSLDENLFVLDVGIDKAAETGLAVRSDQTQALELHSNGDHFDVFISVLPQT